MFSRQIITGTLKRAVNTQLTLSTNRLSISENDPEPHVGIPVICFHTEISGLHNSEKLKQHTNMFSLI